jgi:hypothetical protein
MDEDEIAFLEEQIRLSKSLTTGFAFSLVWLAGIGSLISLIVGIRALMKISRSGQKLSGSWLAWWCVIVGGIGAIALPWYVIGNFVTR